MKNISVIFITTFLIMVTGCSSESIIDFNQENANTALVNTMQEPEWTASFCEKEEVVCYSDLIQYIFKPKNVIVFPRNIIDIFFFSEDMSEPEETLSFIRFYPFGEIMAQETEGKASFMIFIKEGYQVEQQANLLRVIPIDDTQSDREPVFMEITQVPNITVEEMGEQIIESLGNDRELCSFLSPRESFPYASIRLREELGNRRIEFREMIFIRDNAQGGVFLATISETSSRTANLRNALKTLEIITEQDFISMNNNNTLEDSYTDSVITIQDLFAPRFVVIFMEGMPLLVRHYPFGEIVEAGTEGMASFVIFIDDSYQVEQHDNSLRVTPLWDNSSDVPEAFMEIKQVPNITIEEMEHKVEASFNLDYFYFFRRQFPEGSVLATFSPLDSAHFNDIYIRNNGNGGVFVVTMQYCHEGATGHGVSFLNSIWTMKTIEISEIEDCI